MAVRSFLAPLWHMLGLAVRWPSLAAMAVMIAAYFYVYLTVGEWAQQVENSDPRPAALISFSPLATGALAAVLQFLLSRRFGGERGETQSPKILTWMGLVPIYGLGSSLPGAIVAALLPLIGIRPAPFEHALIVQGCMLITTIALFPVLVRLVALAHSGDAVTLPMISTLLVYEKPGIYVSYAILVSAISALAFWVMPPFPQSFSQITTGDAAIQGLWRGVTAIPPILLAIVAFREARPNAEDRVAVFS